MARNGITTATFDCFGTLIDWEGGLGNFLYDFALRHGDENAPDGNTLRERWEAIQFGVIQGPFKPYVDVLAESLRLWAEERGYPYTDADGEALARSMRSWQPFHDTRPALERVRRAGIKLVVISNSQHSLISHSLKHIGVPFDDVITAEDCRAYKPADTVFEQSLARIGEPAERLLHVAFGFKYDIGPAQRFGWRTAWVNRNAEPKPGQAVEQPDHIWRDLWGLAEFAGFPYDG
ncbi:MAG: 2-haloacid dehalogenase [Thermomicrobiales bacterium]|jgi:2-haloalkanoic acid dehalogenase type II|nr:2-haloacid dehalogenase [Thermomicrobiales bacterium]